jgi:hypothetical protein
VGCSPHKQIVVSRSEKQLPTISPLVGEGLLSAFGPQIYRTASLSKLVISVAEATPDRSSPCWRSYRATAAAGSSYPVVSLIPTSKKNNAICTLQAVRGPFYVLVHLPVRYSGPDVIDAGTGRVIQVSNQVSYTSSELITP